MTSSPQTSQDCIGNERSTIQSESDLHLCTASSHFSGPYLILVVSEAVPEQTVFDLSWQYNTVFGAMVRRMYTAM